MEWDGTPIGAGNCITRTRTRTAVHDKSIDAKAGLRDTLVNAAVGHLTRRAGREEVLRHDVIIHGVRVRATTNSPHLHDFWVDNWYSPEEWKSVTGLVPPRDPQVTVYALGGVADQQEAAYYSRKTNTIVFFNTAYYGQLKSWVLGAVGRVLAEEFGIHSVHGACVEKDGKGVLYIAPTGTGKSTSSYGLVTFPHTRFHSDDWVYVRYTYQTADGTRLHPMQIALADGQTIKGFRVFRWLAGGTEADGQATVTGLDLGNHQVTVPLDRLNRTERPVAYAFTSEKIFYLRTNLVENFPLSAPQMLRSKMENVPDLTPRYLQEHRPMLDDLVAAIRGEGGDVTEYFAGYSPDDIARVLGRMIAFDNARAMLEIGKVLPAERVYSNPMEPARLASVILLKRDRDDPTVVEHLRLGSFIGRLLIGETPDKKREVAYNAYRAVDDDVERAYLTALEAAAGGDGADAEALFAAYDGRTDAPETLQEEFELFRVMYEAARTYGLNTILTVDPQVKDKKEAVELTMDLIARLVEEDPSPLRLTLSDYRSFLPAGSRRT
jgi:hypothetical protein